MCSTFAVLCEVAFVTLPLQRLLECGVFYFLLLHIF